MGRFRLGAVTVFTLAALVGRADAAEMTRVASRGEPGNPFDLHVSLRWDRLQERAQITREVPILDASGAPTGAIEDGDELRYSRVVNAVVPRVAVAIAQDLEIHFEWPYVLGDEREWRFGLTGAAPSGGVPPVYVSTIESNRIDADGQPCPDGDGDGIPDPCPLFPVAPKTTIYRGGRAGDLKSGVAWGIFNDRKDPTKPFWLVGLDVTFPTAARYDPAADRGTDWSSPNNAPGHSGPFGEKVWKWDLYTVLSRRLGPIDPYVKAHATVMSESSSTYSNCEHAAELSDPARFNPIQMNSAAAANCTDPGWADDAGARLPWIAGITVGTELVPWEDEAAQQRLAIDVRLFGDYTSSQRFYNELTDASGRIHETGDYLTLGGFFGFYVRASRYVSLHATASLATNTAHYLTGESLGRDGGWPALSAVQSDPSLMNPNFDWRYDAPGRRFRISEVSLFQLSFGGTLRF
jgi:hypothetical protein